MKLIEVIADCGHLDTLAGLAEQHKLLDHWYTQTDDGERTSFRMLVDDETRQPALDTLQSLLASSSNDRIVVMPVEAILPRPQQNNKKSKKQSSSKSTREELYSLIEKGARLDFNFLVLTFLSTIVAAIGLLENNVAVVIGAMVIAPHLGPNIALALAAGAALLLAVNIVSVNLSASMVFLLKGIRPRTWLEKTRLASLQPG